MALVFTDNQLRELTGQIANSKAKLDGLNEEKANIAKIKDDYKSLDEQEKVFTDHWINSIQRFHNELKLLNGTQKTTYSGSSVDPSAKLEVNSLHFPTGYVNFKPKLDQSNIGLPQSVFSGDKETTELSRCLEWSNRIKSGFTGSNLNGTGTYSGTSLTLSGTSVGPIPVGSYIAIYTNTSLAVWGTVESYNSTSVGTPPDPVVTTEQLTINVIRSYGVLAGTVNWMLSHAGFSEANRVAASTNGYLLLCRDTIDFFKNSSKQFVNDETAELNANDSKPDKTDIDSAKSSNNTFVSNLDNWSSKPTLTRFNDTNLASLNSYLNDRTAYIPTRISKIEASLGNINQQSNGDFSGSGRYLDLFNSIMLRTHKTTGHLRNYYQQGMLGQNIDERISMAVTQTDRDKDLVIVKLFKEEPTNTPTVELVDISNINLNDDVAIMDNEYTTINRYKVLEVIQPNKLVLSDVVPTTYKLEFQVRLVKMT